ncbi:MAG: hypothetical protein FWF35_02330, partial [Elusimicrobia bacterium]|nr:hypothetical protein [Elusimicrobiota bacterium]
PCSSVNCSGSTPTKNPSASYDEISPTTGAPSGTGNCCMAGATTTLKMQSFSQSTAEPTITLTTTNTGQVPVPASGADCNGKYISACSTYFTNAFTNAYPQCSATSGSCTLPFTTCRGPGGGYGVSQITTSIRCDNGADCSGGCTGGVSGGGSVPVITNWTCKNSSGQVSSTFSKQQSDAPMVITAVYTCVCGISGNIYTCS